MLASVLLAVGAGSESPAALLAEPSGEGTTFRISAPRCPASGTVWCEPEQRCVWSADGCGGAGRAEAAAGDDGRARMSREEEDFAMVEAEVEDAEATAVAAAVAAAAAPPPAETGGLRLATARSRAGARPGAFVPHT